MLEHASVTCTSVTITSSSKLERVRRKFIVHCQNCFFFQNIRNNLLEILYLQTVHTRRRDSDALFLTNIYN
jgi:hypothetical protein